MLSRRQFQPPTCAEPVRLTWASGVPAPPPRRRGPSTPVLTPALSRDSRALHAIGAPAPGRHLHDRHRYHASSGTLTWRLTALRNRVGHWAPCNLLARDERLGRAWTEFYAGTRPRRGRADRSRGGMGANGKAAFFRVRRGLYRAGHPPPPHRQPMLSTAEGSKESRMQILHAGSNASSPDWGPLAVKSPISPSRRKETGRGGIEKQDRRLVTPARRARRAGSMSRGRRSLGQRGLFPQTRFPRWTTPNRRTDRWGGPYTRTGAPALRGGAIAA